MKPFALLSFCILILAFAAHSQKVFIGQNFNEVGNELSILAQEKYGMTEKKSELNDGVMNVYFIPKVFTANDQSLSFHYTLKDGVITKIEIRGTKKELLNIFTGYWKTKTDYIKDGAQKHFISDIIRFNKLQQSITITAS